MIFENPCRRAMLRKIATFEKAIFGEDAMPFKDMLKAWKKNKYMFCTLREGEKFIGFADMFVINAYGRNHLLARNGVAPFSVVHYVKPKYMRKSGFVYFEGIGAVGKGDEKKERVAALMYGRASAIEDRFDLPRTAYAVGVTKEGIALLRSYGGKCIRIASSRGKKYPLFRILLTHAWCDKVKARASNRLVSGLVIKRGQK